MKLTKPVQKIILIDDDNDDAALFKDALELINPQIEFLHIPDFSIDRFERELRPQLVFMDINMPRLNGFECLQQLRQNKYYSPVVMYSTSCSKENIDLALSLGADYYLCKPNSYSKLVALLREALDIDWSTPLQQKVSIAV